jgi:hypothetical protein
MPGQPTPQDLHVNTLLTNISIGYTNQAYIADRIFPVVTVSKQSDIIPKFNQSAFFRDDAKVRAPATASEAGGFTVDTTATYFANRYSRRFEIPDELRRNADAPWNLDATATRFVTDKVQMRREISFATNYFASSKGWTDVTGGTDVVQWSDYASSTPDIDIDYYMDAVEGTASVEPNKLVVGKQVHLQLKNHPALIDRIKYTQRATLTEDLIASLLGQGGAVGVRSVGSVAADAGCRLRLRVAGRAERAAVHQDDAQRGARNRHRRGEHVLRARADRGEVGRVLHDARGVGKGRSNVRNKQGGGCRRAPARITRRCPCRCRTDHGCGGACTRRGGES